MEWLSRVLISILVLLIIRVLRTILILNL